MIALIALSEPYRSPTLSSALRPPKSDSSIAKEWAEQRQRYRESLLSSPQVPEPAQRHREAMTRHAAHGAPFPFLLWHSRCQDTSALRGAHCAARDGNICCTQLGTVATYRGVNGSLSVLLLVCFDFPFDDNIFACYYSSSPQFSHFFLLSAAAKHQLVPSLSLLQPLNRQHVPRSSEPPRRIRYSWRPRTSTSRAFSV